MSDNFEKSIKNIQMIGCVGAGAYLTVLAVLGGVALYILGTWLEVF